MRYQVVPHNPGWKNHYASEADQIARALHGMAARLHHIGSTAIPHIAAKPIIDILIDVDDLSELDARSSAIEQLGYEAMGEFGIPGRRYFRKNDAMGNRTHQIHAFEVGSSGAMRHLAFRDYMIAHPEAAQAYGALKEQLAAQHPDDFEAYMDGKKPSSKKMRPRLWFGISDVVANDCTNARAVYHPQVGTGLYPVLAKECVGQWNSIQSHSLAISFLCQATSRSTRFGCLFARFLGHFLHRLGLLHDRQDHLRDQINAKDRREIRSGQITRVYR
jgi:GrpB-like predicted nucleotidyltransferase (UPF0157 family)